MHYLDIPLLPAATAVPAPLPMVAIKAAQRLTWEMGDFGRIAATLEPAATEFITRLGLAAPTRVLDAACGTGNLAILAAQQGCEVHGVDIARNLLQQARRRAASQRLPILFQAGDVEALPYEAHSFDYAVSMFGLMFAPRPMVAVAEAARVLKPGGQLALANWTPEGFLGQLFRVFQTHQLRPTGLPSPMSWGCEEVVRVRLTQSQRFHRVRCRRRQAIMRFPFGAAETVDFFRAHYGPAHRAFAALDTGGQAALRRDLVALFSAGNTDASLNETVIAGEYLEVVARRTEHEAPIAREVR